MRSSAGARLTVIRRGGWTKPALRIAPRTRSRASWTARHRAGRRCEPGQAGRDIDLDPDDPPVEALERGGEQRGQHAATLRARAYRRLTGA